MKTYSFVGSDKNAGKTTAFNFIYSKLSKSEGDNKLVLLSIGINGESIDNFTNKKKPSIQVNKDDYFITKSSHLKNQTGLYETCHFFGRPIFSEDWILARAHFKLNIVLEGPNNGCEIELLKKYLKTVLTKATILLDGSIDRQFIARPSISDEFYFSLNMGLNNNLTNRAKKLIYSLNIKPTSNKTRELIKKEKKNKTKALLINKSAVIYNSFHTPIYDTTLNDFLNSDNEYDFLYIFGALTNQLLYQIALKTNLELIVDNFTLLNTSNIDQRILKKIKITLLNPCIVRNIFIKGELHSSYALSNLPNDRIHNIFKEDYDEIKI